MIHLGNRLFIWTSLTDHRFRFFKNNRAMGIRFNRYCISVIYR